MLGLSQLPDQRVVLGDLVLARDLCLDRFLCPLHLHHPSSNPTL